LNSGSPFKYFNFLFLELVEQYLSKTGQTFQYLMSGAMQYGPSFIHDQLVPMALKANKKIKWKTFLVDGEDVGLLQWELEDITPFEL